MERERGGGVEGAGRKWVSVLERVGRWRVLRWRDSAIVPCPHRRHVPLVGGVLPYRMTAAAGGWYWDGLFWSSGLGFVPWRSEPSPHLLVRRGLLVRIQDFCGKSSINSIFLRSASPK